MIEVEKQDLVEMLARWEESSYYKGAYLQDKHGDLDEIRMYREKYLGDK
jgi:hypothetical protein